MTTTLFGLWGAGLMLWRRRADAALFVLPLVVFPLPYYLTHPDFRFRLVLEPVMIALGAYAVTQVWPAVRGRFSGRQGGTPPPSY